MSDKPKPVKAWAVVQDGGDILAERLLRTRKGAEAKVTYWKNIVDFRVIPVLITPIGENHD